MIRHRSTPFCNLATSTLGGLAALLWEGMDARALAERQGDAATLARIDRLMEAVHREFLRREEAGRAWLRAYAARSATV